jgi:hypothetical protein
MVYIYVRGPVGVVSIAGVLIQGAIRGECTSHHFFLFSYVSLRSELKVYEHLVTILTSISCSLLTHVVSTQSHAVGIHRSISKSAQKAGLRAHSGILGGVDPNDFPLDCTVNCNPVYALISVRTSVCCPSSTRLLFLSLAVYHALDLTYYLNRYAPPQPAYAPTRTEERWRDVRIVWVRLKVEVGRGRVSLMVRIDFWAVDFFGLSSPEFRYIGFKNECTGAGVDVRPISVSPSIPFHPSNHKYELQLTVISINPTLITSVTLLLGTNTMAVDSITLTATLSTITTGCGTTPSSSIVGASTLEPSKGAAVVRNVGLGLLGLLIQ